METEARWTVLHVRPRCEKKVAEYCDANQVGHYLPLREETKIYQRRRVTVQKPLFPGYVFAALSSADRPLVLRSQAIVHMLPVTDEALLLRELDQVRRALSVDPTLGATQAFSKGRHVRITGGPFLGLEGVVVELTKGDSRVMLNVDMIGQAVALDIARELLEVLD